MGHLVSILIMIMMQETRFQLFFGCAAFWHIVWPYLLWVMQHLWQVTSYSVKSFFWFVNLNDSFAYWSNSSMIRASGRKLSQIWGRLFFSHQLTFNIACLGLPSFFGYRFVSFLHSRLLPVFLLLRQDYRLHDALNTRIAYFTLLAQMALLGQISSFIWLL